MAEVKWIKIVSDIFDDEKILLIENMPEADKIIVIWFKLLCLAGKNNNSGVFMLNDKIPYTDEMLATIFRRNVSIVRLALEVFEKFGMIEIINGVITIPNWGKHQNLDQLEKKKEYMRTYMSDYRKLQESKVNSKTNSKANVSQADIDIDKNKSRLDIENIDDSCESTPKKSKHKYGQFSNVLLTEEEHQKLTEQSNGQKAIEFLSSYIEEKGYKAKSHYLSILRWVLKAVEERESKNSKSTSGKGVIDQMKDVARLMGVEDEPN